MTDVYRRLAEKLDQLPAGFPKTQSGVELKILKKVFSEAEAELALKLRPIPETAEVIAQRLGTPVEEMRATLDEMAKKGQIGCLKFHGQQVYIFAPFVVGIYEFQLYRIDKELADLFEEYFPILIETLGHHGPALARVVPINDQIKGQSRILPYEDVSQLIADAKSFRLHMCICRKERELAGSPCSYSSEVCMTFSREEGAYDYFTLGGREITKEEALGVLKKAEEEGLVHNVFYNTKSGHFGICNCCPCCCGVLRGVKELGATQILARSNYVARIDVDACSACGVCADERCPMDAITEEDGEYRVDTDRCIGCGVCAPTCPTDAISLEERPEADKTEPPDNILEWLALKAQSRKIPLKFD
jgi:Fe-S-cluster-containing hydrogenase component 2